MAFGAGPMASPSRILLRVKLTIETELEADGRWIAEIMELPGVIAYGLTRDAAVASAQALAFRVIADRIEHGEEALPVESVAFVAA